MPFRGIWRVHHKRKVCKEFTLFSGLLQDQGAWTDRVTRVPVLAVGHRDLFRIAPRENRGTSVSFQKDFWGSLSSQGLAPGFAD